ncbi:hypothetical protein CPB86DRAFT_815464 [Serendipita vermifera]|nr:hypothetical protein CPB86DRAFT_815464 [Serendipita vermifera]
MDTDAPSELQEVSDLVESADAPPPNIEVTNMETVSESNEADGDADEDWDVEMDLGKTGGAKAVPSPPPNASSASWHASMAAVTTAAGYTGTVTRLGGNSKSDVEESWDDFDLDFLSSEETPKGDSHHTSSLLVPHTKIAADLSDWDDDDDDDAIPTIKVAPGELVLPSKPLSSTPPRKPHAIPVVDEDFEEDFSLPEDLAHLSLRPLKHRSSKANLDNWGDNTASSTTYSSEASSFGVGTQESPSSSASNSFYTHAGSETDDDEEGLLDGLVLPEGLFDAEKDNRQLHKIIEEKKRAAASDVPAVVASPQEDEDFETGLVIDDDVDFNLSKAKHRQSLSAGRISKAVLSMQGVSPSPKSANALLPSRAHSLTGSPEQTRTPIMRPKSPLSQSFSDVVRSGAGRREGATSPVRIRSGSSSSQRGGSASLHSSSRRAISPPPSSFPTTSFSVPNRERKTSAGKLQGLGGELDLQRRAIVRKSSLSSIDVSSVTSGNTVRVTLKRPGSSAEATSPQMERRPTLTSSLSASQVGRYNSPAPTRSQSMHSHTRPSGILPFTSTLSHLKQSPNLVPATPPGTPSSNPIALRLTMTTTSSKARSRPPLSSVFPGSSMSHGGHVHTPTRPTSFADVVKSPPHSARSPLSPSHATSASPVTPSRLRPALSRSSTVSAAAASIPHPPQAKILKRPKRLRAYGDGTELDGIEDLPTDRDREGKYRVVPKGFSSGGRVVRKDSGAGRDSNGPGSESVGDSTSSSGAGSKLTQRRRADLTSNRASVSSSATATPSLGRIPLSPSSSPKASTEKRRSLSGVPLKKRPMLIRNLNGVGGPKVVGEMRWNPQTLRWEGNDQVLRDFDNVISSSTRPALITHLSGAALGSPVNSASGIPGARVVGNMLFDPVKMCWISQLPPEEEEPDVFADMADDENDENTSWEKNKNGTIRANSGLLSKLGSSLLSPRSTASGGKALSDSLSPIDGGSSVLVVIGGDELPSPAHSTHSRSQSEMESGSDGGSRLYGTQEADRLLKDGETSVIVSQELLNQTEQAEQRHRNEMRGWIIDPDNSTPSINFPTFDRGAHVTHSEMDRTFLHEIRNLATRRY